VQHAFRCFEPFVNYAMPRPLWGGHPSRMTDSHSSNGGEGPDLGGVEHCGRASVRKSSSRRLFSNGQCSYYRRRQAAGGDGSDHDCCGAEQSPMPGFSSTVWRPAPPLGGHLPAVATLRRHTLARWSEAVDVPSDIVKRLSLSAITTGRTPVHVPMPTAINHRFVSTSP
jgi:hypothetical protein